MRSCVSSSSIGPLIGMCVSLNGKSFSWIHDTLTRTPAISRGSPRLTGAVASHSLGGATAVIVPSASAKHLKTRAPLVGVIGSSTTRHVCVVFGEHVNSRRPMYWVQSLLVPSRQKCPDGHGVAAVDACSERHTRPAGQTTVSLRPPCISWASFCTDGHVLPFGQLEHAAWPFHAA